MLLSRYLKTVEGASYSVKSFNTSASTRFAYLHGFKKYCDYTVHPGKFTWNTIMEVDGIW